MRRLLIVSLVAVLGACAAPPPATVASADPAAATQVACHQESVTGSSMIHTVCTKPQSEAERNALQEDLRRMPPPNIVAHRAAGQ